MGKTLMHEIRNEITALESQIFLLERKLQTEDATVLNYLERMKNSLEKLRTHLGSLQNIAKSAD